MARSEVFSVRVSSEERRLLSVIAAELACTEPVAFRQMLDAAARQLNVLPVQRLSMLPVGRETVATTRTKGVDGGREGARQAG